MHRIRNISFQKQKTSTLPLMFTMREKLLSKQYSFHLVGAIKKSRVIQLPIPLMASPRSAGWEAQHSSKHKAKQESSHCEKSAKGRLQLITVNTHLEQKKVNKGPMKEQNCFKSAC